MRPFNLAALPPDVRKAYGFPERAQFFFERPVPRSAQGATLLETELASFRKGEAFPQHQAAPAASFIGFTQPPESKISDREPQRVSIREKAVRLPLIQEK